MDTFPNFSFFYKIGIHLFSCFMDFMQKKKIEDLVPKSSVVNGRMDEHPFYVPWSQKILGFLRFSGFFVFVFVFCFLLFFFWGGGGEGVFLLVEAIIFFDFVILKYHLIAISGYL